MQDKFEKTPRTLKLNTSDNVIVAVDSVDAKSQRRE